MDFKEAVGTLIAGVALLVPAVKWLIKDWALKAKEVEKLKKQITDTALKKLELEVQSFKASSIVMQKSINEIKIALTSNTVRLEGLQEKFEKTTSGIQASFERSVKKVEDTIFEVEAKHIQLKSEIETKIKTEVVKLSEQLTLIRSKKNGK